MLDDARVLEPRSSVHNRRLTLPEVGRIARAIGTTEDGELRRQEQLLVEEGARVELPQEGLRGRASCRQHLKPNGRRAPGCRFTPGEVRFGMGNGGAEGQDRTVDTRFFRPVLYQLSYLGDPRRSVAARPALPMARLLQGSARTI